MNENENENENINKRNRNNFKIDTIQIRLKGVKYELSNMQWDGHQVLLQ
jgi:hypothetical protein